ncbi:MAG: alpha-ribazole phosphatase family protein [Gammaproteobacteria bacterium]|nr:alpha-ribazole phosphatase family protein [Gammaproteobacteria bacterium]
MVDTVVDFLRHGEPVGTSTYRGNGVDDPLSEKGWSQMWDAVGNHCPWNVIFTSPLSRCRAFADALGERYEVPVQVDERLKEVGFGAWEGRTREEIKESNLAEYEAFYRDPVNQRPEGAEPLDVFFQRVASVYDDVAKKYTGKHVLFVTHAGVIRAAMAHVLEVSPEVAYRIQIANAGVTRFRQGANGAKLDFHNRISF